MKLLTISLLLLVLSSVRAVIRGTNEFEATEGEDIKIKCTFDLYGYYLLKYFCKDPCTEDEDFFILTSSNIENTGKYSIEFVRVPNKYVMYVKIRNARSSDAGSYTCGLYAWGEMGLRSSNRDVIVYVTNAVRSAAGVSETSSASEPQEDHTPLSDVALYVGLTLSAVLILSVTFTILYWRERAHTPREPLQTPGYAHVLEATLTAPVVTYRGPWTQTAQTEEAPVFYSHFATEIIV